MGNSWHFGKGIRGNSWEFAGIRGHVLTTPTTAGQSLLLVFTYGSLLILRLQGHPGLLVDGSWKSSEQSSNIILLLFRKAWAGGGNPEVFSSRILPARSFS